MIQQLGAEQPFGNCTYKRGHIGEQVTMLVFRTKIEPIGVKRQRGPERSSLNSPDLFDALKDKTIACLIPRREVLFLGR